MILALAAALALLPASMTARDKGPSGLKVISYNIRNGEANDGPNSWSYRYPASAMMIMDKMPDVFGVQEAYDYQVRYLKEYCKNYSGVGVGREDGKSEGEQTAIFWNKKTVKMLKWGSFWLSETPGKPSTGWDAACRRTATWALMRDKRSGKKFCYVNTHLDHQGWEARSKGLGLIIEKIAEINPEGLPVVLSGDFNMEIDRPELDGLKKKMKNSRDVAVKTDHLNTYNAWGKEKECQLIDYIWFDGFSSCTEYETVTKPYYERTFISDHFPISAVLIF